MELYAYERRRWLVDQARQAGRIDVAEVARELTVAKETVRRDLTALEAEGLLRRVHGGAIPVERLGFEGTLALRNTSRTDEKGRIADHAIGLVGTAESVYIDEGSTTQAFAERLTPRRPLTVVTNSLPIALVMAPREAVSVVLIGGRVRGKTLGTIDHWALRMLEDFVFDLCVMGTNGLTMERGATCPDAAVAAVKRGPWGRAGAPFCSAMPQNSVLTLPTDLRRPGIFPLSSPTARPTRVRSGVCGRSGWRR